MQDFLSKCLGSSEVCAITCLDDKHALNVEQYLKENKYKTIDNLDDSINELRIGGNFYIPIYKLENVNDWYKYAFEYASGQVEYSEKNIRINPKYENISIIYLMTFDTIKKFDKNIYEVINLTYQAE